MQRSSRSEIRRACKTRTRKVTTFPRVGTPVPTALMLRQRDTANFRDLSKAVRHLTYHICPFANSSEAWQWNLEELRKRWHLFNGLKVLGINHDDDTVTPDDMLKYCQTIGLTWDHVIVRDNDRGLGEVMTWISSLECLATDTASENEIVFSAHAKGVKYGMVMPKVIRDWSTVMYAVNLDNVDIVQQSLEWFVATGGFRGRYSKTAHCRHGWYYSGAFWWWRLADIGRGPWREVGQWYAGRELWIGNQITKSESDCLFMDNTRSPYQPSYWSAKIWPKWKQYQEKIINAQ